MKNLSLVTPLQFGDDFANHFYGSSTFFDSNVLQMPICTAPPPNHGKYWKMPDDVEMISLILDGSGQYFHGMMRCKFIIP